MKVAVFGANGQIGRLFTEQWLQEPSGKVRAVIRDAGQAARFEEMGAETAVADLEGPVRKLTEAITGCDAVVFAAGSGGHTGPDKTLLIDLDGAVKAVEAAEAAGIGRFLLVSALGAGDRERWNESIRHYYVAKHYADRAVQSSKLAYTIVRPGGLENGPGTGRVQAAGRLDRGSIPRADVAAVLAAALREPRTVGQAFDLVSGETPIDEALGAALD
ncbi:SDR family oxidoreductase [Paenibacillus sp. IB182496]|uniref:SDR family oxidoreductase n=1 Tax=Paenibacillus sabuli TaxID=2772509 RepID=A0A927BPA7_9BACL|nr:SDR family oxidoreductase [Paenibacillus sabuli]MBD2843772.1 SDR family oxidoreductase [Paenibacillus sabuli]